MIKNFVKILELLGDRLEVCVSVYFHVFRLIPDETLAFCKKHFGHKNTPTH